MSGHSHFHSIKHKKAAEDKKRGKIFSKFAKMIAVAAKDGTDPSSNPKLRQALEQARSFNMPKENIERAIKRGSGQIEGKKLEQATYEAFGPDRIAIILECITDNKNRTLSEIKQILQRHGGKLAESGSVKWLFEKKGVIVIENKNQEENSNQKKQEELELSAIEAGAEDTKWDNDALIVYTKPDELEKVKKNLEKKGVEINSFSLDWVAKEAIKAGQKERKKIEELFEDLDESEDVQDFFSNIEE
ncbi:YebC/PmpR family DNA-binding transcriptional regulator [bacterium]|nr:YebC/PmpR family DNA-binding transcriptional regulator [bacterium]